MGSGGGIFGIFKDILGIQDAPQMPAIIMPEPVDASRTSTSDTERANRSETEQDAERRRRRAANRSAGKFVLTSGLGLTDEAPTQQHVLLGGG
jgi:hypothetical protein